MTKRELNNKMYHHIIDQLPNSAIWKVQTNITITYGSIYNE